MPAAAIKKETTAVTVIRKMRDYTKEAAFVKKAEAADAFLKKHPLPKSFKKSK